MTVPDDFELLGLVPVTLELLELLLRACASASDSKATNASDTSNAARVVLTVLIIVQFQGLIDMVPLRQCAESLFVFPPIVLDVGKLVPLLEFQSYIIRATYFIEKAVAAYDIEGTLIRVKLCNCLHHIELSLSYTGFFIVSEKILKTFYKLSFLAAGEWLEPYCPE